MKSNLFVLGFALAGNLTLVCNAMAEVETYKIDDNHSFANWSIRHVVAKASGTFSDIKGNISIDRVNLANSSIEAKINV